ncbi:MAG: hypothetical protein IH941_00275 [Acidobacteria bacterium]|nr:hypothetical protein [Acidobacteriota bacterium]
MVRIVARHRLRHRTGGTIPDTRYRMPDTRCPMPDRDPLRRDSGIGNLDRDTDVSPGGASTH